MLDVNIGIGEFRNSGWLGGLGHSRPFHAGQMYRMVEGAGVVQGETVDGPGEDAGVSVGLGVGLEVVVGVGSDFDLDGPFLGVGIPSRIIEVVVYCCLCYSVWSVQFSQTSDQLVWLLPLG